MFKINQQVLIPSSEDGRYTIALFKGYINVKLCYVKPKENFKKGGYGITITALVTNVRTLESV